MYCLKVFQYSYFTRTTFSTTMSTLIILVKCMCMASVSYMPIYVPIIMYGVRLFIVVIQELHCLQRHNFSISWLLWISISMQVLFLWLLRYTSRN